MLHFTLSCDRRGKDKESVTETLRLLCDHTKQKKRGEGMYSIPGKRERTSPTKQRARVSAYPDIGESSSFTIQRKKKEREKVRMKL